MENIVNLFTGKLSGILSEEAIVFIISMLPVLELRGGLLASSILGVSYLRALIICIIGNLLPIPFVLLFIRHIIEWMECFAPTKSLASWFRKKAEKHSDQIQLYGFWGLALFVGIPLPGTGAWTGALAAALLRMDLRKSIPSILAGVLLASAIMSVLSYGLIANIIHL